MQTYYAFKAGHIVAIVDAINGDLAWLLARAIDAAVEYLKPQGAVEELNGALDAAFAH